MIMKNFTFFLLLFSSTFLVSCNEESITSDIYSENKSSETEKFCVDAFLPGDNLHTSELDKEVSGYGVTTIIKKWNPGDTIKIKFLNGSSYLQDKVRKYASEWLQFANLTFKYVTADQYADIKINFDNSGKSWSYVGTDSKYISQQSPSLNFGWFTDFTPENELSKTILHEFGHVLGLHHEHQNPNSNIKWNKPVVYAYFEGAPNYWNKDQVDFEIFNKYSKALTNYSAFDKHSIMLISFPASFILNHWHSQPNYKLSSTDKKFIAKQYPKSK